MPKRRKMVVKNISYSRERVGPSPDGAVLTRRGTARALKWGPEDDVDIIVLIRGRSWLEGDKILWKWGLK